MRFWSRLSQVLGLHVSNREIKINPDKIKAIEEITVVNNVNVVQRLAERIAALGRFISRQCLECERVRARHHLKPHTGGVIRQSIKTPKLTNNEAEYEAMIAGLELAKGLGPEVIEAKCDSFLVVNQVNRSFKVQDDRMQRYLDKLQVTLHRLREWTLDHVPREQNSKAYALANLG
uniref:RNase H type-1 domain-containing protein n=2 Tax=Nicotiana TaxID=4085 RepID=A0A1S4CHR5_TOBAC|nr:PREDICTED: uncharacterized protein LOC104242480 [Nicotiana sylvestris]XP_016500713.1 PREDICTED: uncharacterized protein LOC107819139 [Nicotiana tabacum]